MIRGLQLMISFYYCSIALSDYGDVRLSGNTTGGKLEIGMTNNQWSSVCHDGFSDAAATVACRQLGYDHASYYSIGRDPTFGVCQVTCTGKENRIQDCKLLWRLYYYCHGCVTNDIVGISCSFNFTNTTTTSTTAIDSTITTSASLTLQRTDNYNHSNCVYTSDSISMPGIVAGTVGGLAMLLIVAALLIGYLLYNCYCHRLQSTVDESHSSDIMSESEPPPYHPPVAMDYIHAKSIYSLPKGSLSDPPPSYSSLA